MFSRKKIEQMEPEQAAPAAPETADWVKDLPPVRKPRPGKLSDAKAVIEFLERTKPGAAAASTRPTSVGRSVPGILFRRARVGDLLQLVEFMNYTRLPGVPETNREEIVKDWATWGYWLVVENQIRGCASWQVNNFVACVRNLRFYSPEDRNRLAPGLLGTLEGAGWSVACQIVVLLVHRQEPGSVMSFRRAGYRPIDDIQLIRRDWRETIEPYVQPEHQIMLKLLE